MIPSRSVILDLAVRTGIVAAELAALGHRLVGMDLSLGMLRHAARRLPGRADATAIPLPNSCIDMTRSPHPAWRAVATRRTRVTSSR
ncbi:class I SAM-dependent methyltransferase [Nocardia sp. NBC_01499]|uniref:class I SAM-dependent methyltransferase n=1 Tax=Nocardia sp. NBC_01499 TaxID=2903597 RepID=UPI003865DE80